MTEYDPEHLVEIRIRQKDDQKNRHPSCTGSYYCALIAAPELLTVNSELGMCSVRDGVSIEVNDIQYSSGRLTVEQVPNAVAALIGCDSEAVIIVDDQGGLHDAQNSTTIQRFASDI